MADVVVVLGCDTSPDGSPTEMMRSRVLLAAELYKSIRERNSIAPPVIFTGFQGPGQTITEAKAMQKFALENELIDSKHIILEEKASSTGENAYFTRIIIDSLGHSAVHVVTSSFHMERSQGIFQKLYPPKAYSLHFHESAYKMDDEEKELREFRETKLKEQIDLHIGIIAHNAASPDGKQITILTSTLIPKNIFNHGFTMRHGGISTCQSLASLNLMYSLKKRDPLINVQENRRRLSSACGFRIATFHPAKTCHESTVWVLGDPEPDSYDAMVTSQSHVTLAAPGADCAILLFCDPVKKVCGAAHSGWRGTLTRISHKVLQVFTERFSCDVTDICVTLGPSIGPCCFEVGEDLAEQFISEAGEDVVLRKDGSPRPFVNMRLTIRKQLEEKGVLPKNIEDGTRIPRGVKKSEHPTQCTVCDSRFFSFRRDGDQFGNQLGFINIRT